MDYTGDERLFDRVPTEEERLKTAKIQYAYVLKGFVRRLRAHEDPLSVADDMEAESRKRFA